jgi:hypothetical protein
MTDLVEQLKEGPTLLTHAPTVDDIKRANAYLMCLCQEAADEIERLQALLEAARSDSLEYAEKLATMTDLAEDWAIRAKEAQHQLREVTKDAERFRMVMKDHGLRPAAYNPQVYGGPEEYIRRIDKQIEAMK